MITGDHGAVFNFLQPETAEVSPYILDTNTVNVPFYLYFNGAKSIELKHNILASHIDILPTTLDLLGINIDQQLQGRSLFDSKAKSRVIFVYNDYYHHIIAALTSNRALMRDMTDRTTILSKSFSFKNDICPDEAQVCSLLSKKVEEFVQFQNQRLFLLYR
jgi:arylsulfatase A-like enzyme